MFKQRPCVKVIVPPFARLCCAYSQSAKEKALINQALRTKRAPLFDHFVEKRSSFTWYARLDSNQRPLESELSGRQAGKPCGARAWLRLHKFPPFWRKTSEALSDRASEVFRDSSQIVVWIKCGFSSPVQLNIFTLYPWIRSAASHPSTLARSSTIPACAFASSYCFCS